MGSKKDEMTVSNEVMLNAVKALQANAGIRFTLLGRPFVAAFSKSGSGDTLDIAFVIMPEPGSKAEPCTVGKLCQGLNCVVAGVTGEESSTAFREEDIGGQIHNYTDTAENGDVSLQLPQLVLYVRKKAGDAADVQYAFSVAVNVEDFGLKFGDGQDLVSMDSVWVSIWNTDIECIRKTMQIESIDQMLELDTKEQQ